MGGVKLVLTGGVVDRKERRQEIVRRAAALAGDGRAQQAVWHAARRVVAAKPGDAGRHGCVRDHAVVTAGVSLDAELGILYVPGICSRPMCKFVCYTQAKRGNYKSVIGSQVGSRSGVRSSVSLTPKPANKKKRLSLPNVRFCGSRILSVPNEARCRKASAPRKKREGEKKVAGEKTGRTVDAPKSKAFNPRPIAPSPLPCDPDRPGPISNPRSPSQLIRPDQTTRRPDEQTRSAQIPHIRPCQPHRTAP